MSAFLKQVDAAQKFLRGVKSLPNFPELADKQVSRLQKMLDKVNSVTTEQAAAILDLLDESLWTEDAVSKLKTMVAEMTAEAEGSQVKRDTQDYRMLPYYMSEKLSEQLKGKQCQENVALQALCKHAWLLGLRCPSELTLAILLCMAHYNSVSRMSDKDKYNLLLSKKPLMKKWLGGLPDPSPYLLSLPQDPQDLPAGMLSAAFPEGNVVEGPLPAAEILLLAKQMPLRVSNKAVTDPKTAAAQGSGMMNSPARAFGHMMAGLMKGMGSYRAEPSPKVTILDTPKAAPQPRLLALEDARPEPPVLPAKSTDTPAGGVGRTTTVAQEVDAQIGGESIEENLLNLRKSLSGADEDKEAAAMKRPASKAVVPAGINTKRPAGNIKRPAAADVEAATPAHPKKAKKDVQATAVTVLKRPASKSGSKSAASVARASAEERSNLLREIPLAVRKQYANGCATCRYRPGCCVSCWRKRGY